MSIFLLPNQKGKFVFLLFAWIFWVFTGSAFAGPGHDHGPAEPVEAGPSSPRLVAVSETYELVAILKDQELTVYLDSVKDTSPVVSAVIQMDVNGKTLVAQSQTDGTYKIKTSSLSKAGTHEVIITIVDGQNTDLLVGSIKIPEEDHIHSNEEGTSLIASHSLLTWLILASLVGIAGLFFSRFAKSSAKVIIGLSFLVILINSTPILAGPGHDHGDAGSTLVQGDAPKRLPDGEIFLPKPTQRLLEVRTKILSPQTARAVHKLIGRVIVDPNRSGLVQSTISGRLKPPVGGLPFLGKNVRAGDILATVEPSFDPIDASDVRQTAGELDQRIAILDARITRQRKLVSKNITSRANLQELEIERTGLLARRKQLKKSRSEPEVLVAPVNGVIAEVRVAVGQVVNRADTLFRIVDTSSLWVEAISYDAEVRPETGKIRAKTDKGKFFDLKLVGRSRALQQQASVIHFSILSPTSELSIGSPIKVLVEKGDVVQGIIIPRRAIAQAPNGQFVTFKRLEPERYMPVAVRIKDLDGERVYVTSGLKAGDQIIVKGAPLVNQIR